MSLLEDIREESAAKGPPCGLQPLMDSLSTADRTDLETALADQSIYGSTIAKVLRARGYSLADATLRRHRKGDCSCQTS